MNKHTNNTITFNTSTNTCFSCGMPVRASTIRKASGGYTSTTTGAGYTYGLGSGITIGSQRDYATRGRDRSETIATQCETAEDNEYEEIDYNALDPIFKEYIDRRFVMSKKDKRKIIFNTEEAATLDLFVGKLSKYPYTVARTNTVMIKIRFGENEFRMGGKPLSLVKIQRFQDIEALWSTVLQRVYEITQEYSKEISEIGHIELSFVPVKANLLTKYRYDNHKSHIQPLLENTFHQWAPMPVTVDPKYLGSELSKVIEDDKIVNIKYRDEEGNSQTLQEGSLTDPKLDITRSFKFYQVTLQNKDYIIGINYLSPDSVRKIRLNKQGAITEDVTDTLQPGNKIIRRNSNGQTIIMKGNRIIEAYKTLNVRAIPRLKEEKGKKGVENDKIGVIDTETFKTSKENIHKIYACGFKTSLDREPVTFYIKDAHDPDETVIRFVDEMLRSKYEGIKFYCHNFGGYDVLFIMKVLVTYNQLHGDTYTLGIIPRDNKILGFVITKGDLQVRIYDSYAIFSSKLKDLAEAFNTKHTKGIFPYQFSTTENLFYIGDTPSLSYFPNNTKYEDYAKLIGSEWDFKKQTIEYLDEDLNTLYEVMRKGAQWIFLDHNINLVSANTIASLAIKIFLMDKYYDLNLPSITKKSMYTDLKQGYYGGITEVYRPYGENLFYYDINSMYPKAALNPMPGVKNWKYHSVVSPEQSNAIPFGMWHCEVDTRFTTVPYLGLLPFRQDDGLTFPHGQWKGWYFSEEIRFAREHGYVITLTHGYSFSKSYKVFDKYIDTMYKLKANPASDAQKAVSKSLLNNLLGRFGIKLDSYTTKLVDDDTLNKLAVFRDISFHQEIGDLHLVSYTNSLNHSRILAAGLDPNKLIAHGERDSEANSNIASSVITSAAVTAYARIMMNKYKIRILKEGTKIFYSDTDSLVTDKPLPEDMVHPKELGKFKLEYAVDKGVFISGKTYCLLKEEKDGLGLVRKAKGVSAKNLLYQDYMELIVGDALKTDKVVSHKDYSEGSVEIRTEKVLLKGDVYTKRTKIFDGNYWVDTKPLYIGKSLVVYSEPCLSLTVIRLKKRPVSSPWIIPDGITSLPSADKELSSNQVENSLLTNDWFLYPLFGLLMVFYLFGKAYNHDLIPDSLEEQHQDSLETISESHNPLSSIPDMIRRYYTNDTSFTERLIESKKPDIGSQISFAEVNESSSSLVTEKASVEKEVLNTSMYDSDNDSRPSTAVSEFSRPSTGYSTNTSISDGLISPDLSKDQFTPTTYKDLQAEIENNINNLKQIDNITQDPQIREDMTRNLLDEQRYLLDQKSKHLASKVQMSRHQSTHDDSLHKEVTKLKEEIDSLCSKTKARSLESITEESPSNLD